MDITFATGHGPRAGLTDVRRREAAAPPIGPERG